MIKLFQKIFKKHKEQAYIDTINIFEENTKLNYNDPVLAKSLKVLSLSNVDLKSIKPLTIFTNLEILNISHNRIEDIEALKELKNLRIIDIRFNNIKKLPSWIFEIDKEKIFLQRDDQRKEGIFIEGNPLDKEIVDTLQQNYSKQKSEELEELIPLNRQLITLFIPKGFSSNLDLSKINSKDIKLNISTIEYTKNSPIIPSKFKPHYIVLILNETECCLNPPILKQISKLYNKSKIFLIIEDSNSSNMEEKITFFKTYSNTINIIDVYHAFDEKSNYFIKEEIYNYLEKSQEPNSLWKKSWIELRDEIENSNKLDINREEFQTLADKYNIELEVREELFTYLIRVGSIIV